MPAMLPRYLILVRHSDVDLVPGKPSHEWRLSAHGRARCRAFAPKLQPYRPTMFITSLEPKAAETGQIMAETIGVPWQTAVNLHEHERHTIPYYDRLEDFHAVVEQLFLRPDDLVLGEETAVQASARFAAAVRAVLTAHPVGNPVIVTHGTVISLFVHRYNPQLAPIAFWRQLTLPAAIILSRPDFCFITQVTP